MWINATLNVIIKTCFFRVTAGRGDTVLVQSFSIPTEDPSLKNSHFPCLVAGIARHFERKVVMVFIDLRWPASSSRRSNNTFCSFK